MATPQVSLATLLGDVKPLQKFKKSLRYGFLLNGKIERAQSMRNLSVGRGRDSRQFWSILLFHGYVNT
ncbi:hypothetical protein C7449_107201 [Mycoplana dimorpha]|uniref:Uncharacterized protein n=1 Tax=Mycoplana dimorpha TaxID=28320 RepID=A0A2T5B1B9_MYCDI|nr:hypothetical protein C7449_107201 [Mycoplana dimorpha]